MPLRLSLNEVIRVPSVDEILAALADRGYRETESRRLIARAVAARETAFSAQDICAELAPRGVGRATVFRTLNLLHEVGLLNRLHVGDGCHWYTVCNPHHHHHLVCVQCGSVYPLGECRIASEAGQVAARVGFVVEGHHMEVFGRCAACAAS
jgi:Fur family ferric uptake transcriptional regulator